MEILYLFYVVVKLLTPIKGRTQAGVGGLFENRVMRKIFGPKMEKVKGY
jgi:hypothetical protein